MAGHLQINIFKKENTENKILLGKIDKVIEKVKTLDPENINDESISRYLSICDLNDKIREETNESK